MKTVTTRDVRWLIEHRDEPCVSVYMTTDPVLPGGPAEKVRLKNLLREAARRLGQIHDRRVVEDLLVPVAEKVRASWPPQGRGIALLRSPDVNLGFQLPVEVPDMAVVASTFHTKPLVSYLDRNRHFFVLTLAEKSARLLEGTAEQLVDVTADAIPAELRAGGERRHAEPYVGVHGAASPGRTMARRGQDEPDQPRKDRLRRWFIALDAAVVEHLRPTEAPLVLAGVRAHRALYGSVCEYPWLLDGGIDGNVDRLAARELHALAWPVVRRYQTEIESEAAVQYLAALRTGKASDVLTDVIAAAAAGRVRLLLHREGAHLWGRMEPDTGHFVLRENGAEIQPGDSDLIDDLCEMTLVRGGDAVELAPVRMPTDVPIAAILRY
jgi:release factor family 3